MREKPAPNTHHLGFSLIELLTVMGILGIVAALAAPSFSEAIVRNRIVSENNDFLTGLSYARSEAIKRRNGVGICSLDAALTGCGAGAWDRGWAIWEDTNNNGAFDAGEAVLRVSRLDAQSQLASGTAAMVFNARGARSQPALAAGNVTLTLQPVDCKPTASNIRLLTIRPTGSAGSVTQDCP